VFQLENLMPHYKYDRLSAQDATFLMFETPEVYMHISATMIFDLGPLETDAGGVDIDAIKKATEAVLHLIPRYREKLAWIPFFNHPVWVDDRDFNLDYHIRHTSLPRPGGLEQLKRLSARIMSHQLDRSRPLWETWVVEGLEGARFAMITKLHHCMIDGESGADLAQILMSTDPQHRLPAEVPAYIPRPAPTATELLVDEMTLRASLPLQALRSFQAFSRESENLRDEIAMRARALGSLVGWAVSPPSETPVNGQLGPHRNFDWLTMELGKVKAVRRALGCTVNDVVLTTVTGAVRRFMIRRRVRPEDIDFRVSAPVSVRNEGDKGTLGNKVSSWIVRLPIGEADPKKQLEAIHAVTQELKSSKQALGVEMMMAAAEWTPGLLLSLGARAASGPINMIVTNVPGPQFPLYLLGAKLLESFPQVPLLQGTGIGVALFSYDGKVCWGFNSDYGLLPDLEDFQAVVQEAFDELCELAGVDDSPADVHQLHPDPRVS
jgi:diacylglycerol O-acyltransferase